MSETITLDKHEMVVDREDFEALEKSHAELLEACKELLEAAKRGFSPYTDKAEQAIAKAEGRS